MKLQMDARSGYENSISKVFAIINWLNFSFSQKFSYKKKKLSDEYQFLYATFLSCVADDRDNSFDEVIRGYLCKKAARVKGSFPRLNEKVCAKRIRKHLCFGNKTDLRYLLVSQVSYTLNLVGIPQNEEFKVILRDNLLFKEKEFTCAMSYAENPRCISDKRLAQSFAVYLEFTEMLSSYSLLHIANVGVCATMSAGKSSFVNALLGHDYLPARNEATTARITSVYDNDRSKNLIGFAMSGDKLSRMGDNLTEKEVDAWNADSDISHILLQGDLDNIGNNGVIVAVHDTPGTNNSSDDLHHKITMDFLTTHDMDALVFVANAEHLGTTDEKALLTELHQKVVARRNIPVIFVLNKADNIDTEKESLDAVIAGYREFLSGIGFADAKIFPVSSKAARLLKMAIKGRGDSFTESECDAFPLIAKKFTKRLVLDDGGSNESIAVEGQTLVDGESYENASLQMALLHTGISKIEKELEAIVR